jgi:hypothetical protein
MPLPFLSDWLIRLTRQAYFHYIWADECSDEEREGALALPLGEEIRQDRHPTAVQNLSRE